MQKKNPANIIAAAMLAAGIALLALTGCQPTSCSGPAGIGGAAATPAKGTIDDAFKAITDSSEENIANRLGYDAVERIKAAEGDPAAVYDALFGKLTYEVVDSNLNEDDGTGTAHVSITNVDVPAVISSYQNAMATWAMSEDAVTVLANEGQEGLAKHGIEAFLETFAAEDLPTTTRELSVELTRDADGNWQLVNEEALINGALGGINPSALF